jgi:two-component system sensor histidine kinase UhpB
VELVIYRVAQEGLTNALRHAGATEVTLSLRQEGGQVVLAVRDNGRGLPRDITERGLVGMRERALLIGADLAVGPAGDRGTEILLRVPLEPESTW